MEDSMVLDKIIPKAFIPTNDWDSHRPLLWLALHDTIGTVYEFGCGRGSTRQMYNYCRNHDRVFFSFETNSEYAKRYNETINIETYNVTIHRAGIVFIDCAPAELRAPLIEKYADVADVIVVHDSEVSAGYVYGMEKILNTFKYRVDLQGGGMPSTTAVSNVFDVTRWRGKKICNQEIV